MPSPYILQLELFSVLNASTSDFEIWAEGAQLGGGFVVSSTGTSISLSIPYGGTLPSSLQFRFDDGNPGTIDQIQIRSVLINDRYVNTGNYLSSATLNDTSVSNVTITGNDFLFNDTEPASSEFTTGSTRTFTNANNTFRELTSTADEIFTMLDGRNTALLGSGNDKVSGGSGVDIFRGGAGADLLYGAGGNDKIYGGDDNDILYGGDGNDRLHGEGGDDEIHGGAGADKLVGHEGNDTITGGSGNDNLIGGSGNDILYGDDGEDQISAGDGNDTVDGGSGNDLIYGGTGADQLNGGDGIDILIGEAGNDIISGDAGADTILGGDGNDTLYGGADNDYISGETGQDTIDGGTGNDVLVGGAGVDLITGGAGNDVLHGNGLTQQQISTVLNANPGVVYNAGTNSFYLNGGNANQATAYAAATGMSINGVAGHLANVTSAEESAFIRSQVMTSNEAWIGASDVDQEGRWVWTDGAEADFYFWEGQSASDGGVAINNAYSSWPTFGPNNGSNNQHHAWMFANGEWDDVEASFAFPTYVIEWDAGLMFDDNAIDTLSGGDGNDTLYGYGGNDVLNGDDGLDNIFGGNGDDTINGGLDADNLYGQTGVDTINGGDGNDYIDGGLGDDILNGGTGNDTINGGTGNDTINGEAGADSILGGSGNDIIDGGADADYVDGGAGNDTITGGAGNDVLTGGAGVDIITGGAGDDVLHGHGLTQAQISAVLNTNFGLAYNAGTNSFYLDGGFGDQATAYAAAAGMSINGIAGHLANITSADELAYITSELTSTFSNWIGASDADQEGRWTWTDGAESGFYFWEGGSAGSGGIAINGAYNSWTASQPDNGGSGQDFAFTLLNGDWSDEDGTSGGTGYVIEWDAGLMLADNAIDTLSGGDGNDTLYGYGGNDILNGDDGLDNIFGGNGDDTVNGGLGADNLYGQNGIDTINGGDDNDFIDGGSGNDILFGNDGDDAILGGDDDDTIDGGIGADSLYGQNGDDIIVGDDGNDLIYGGSDNDTINGGANDDVIYGDDITSATEDGLAAFYKMDETSGSTILDSSGNGRNGTYVGGTATWSPTGGQIKGALVMPDPVADHAAEVGTWDVNGSGITIASWIKQDVMTEDARIISKTSGINANDHDWAVFIDDDGAEDRIRIRLTTVNGFSEQTLEGVDMSDYLSQWTHVAVTYDDTTDLITYYINGVAMGTDTHSFGGAVITGTGDTIAIGNNPRTISESRQFEGAIDEVRIYERELSSSEISDIYTDLADDGDDILNGDDGDDTINGGGGNDTITGGIGADTINGSVGNDLIFGNANDDTIYGDEGDDEIYGSDNSAQTAVADILTANPSISYNASTGNFYQFVAVGQSWTASNAAANASTLGGASGHLAVISSAEENSFITTMSGATTSWIGGSDATTEGEWFWITGPESGTQFHTGGAGGGAVGGLYSNWEPGDPSNGSTAWDYTVHLAGGTWWSDAVTQTTYDGYIIEWEGGNVLGTTGTDTLSGGDGSDTLYGTDGVQDIFAFNLGETGTDIIENFTAADTDALDIANLLTGYTAGTSDINDFVQFTNSGANILVQIDANGATGGATFTTIAQINDLNDLDATALFYNGSIIA